VNGLRGRSVVITRSRAQATAFARALADRGATPVFFPTIDIRPLEDCSALDRALTTADRCDWIVFTSANAVSAVWERLAALGLTAIPGPGRIAAVGPATAAALTGRGVQVSAMPADYHGAAIAGALGPLSGLRVLLPRADLGREETAEALREAGAVVEEVVAYHTTPATPDPGGLAALRGTVDAVTFTSPSTVRNFVMLVGPDARDLLARSLVVCIGPVTAAAVTALGLAPPLQPRSSTGEALLDVLEAYFSSAGESA
jgi:uroporphyrinogen III methyltransferase / synthase